MRLRHLRIAGVRNLQAVQLEPAPSFNVVTGDNGSGKTSILEAIGLLGTGRSFRTAALDAVINYAADSMDLFAELVGADESVVRLGVRRPRRGKLEVRMRGETVRSAAVLADVLPVQIIAPDMSVLVTGEPGVRRRFLDWGVFHAHGAYAAAWRNLRRALQQRNAALRSGSGTTLAGGARAQITAAAFDQQFVLASEAVERLRAAYLERLQPVFAEVALEMALELDLALKYRRGWDAQLPLGEILVGALDGDLRAGHTRYGPHRADLRLMAGERRAAEVLSRGQLKCAAFAMLTAQGRLLGRDGGKQAVYLVDDLVSELDATHRRRAIDVLRGLGAQVFVADVAGDSLRELLAAADAAAWFHVKHGTCTRDE